VFQSSRVCRRIQNRPMMPRASTARIERSTEDDDSPTVLSVRASAAAVSSTLADSGPSAGVPATPIVAGWVIAAAGGESTTLSTAAANEPAVPNRKQTDMKTLMAALRILCSETFSGKATIESTDAKSIEASEVLQRAGCRGCKFLVTGILLVSAGVIVADCKDPEYRAFDFWLGQWEVHLANGDRAGSNNISQSQGGCLLEERWTDTQGGTGMSMNYFDAIEGKWHQLWVSDGVIIDIAGGVEDGSMVLVGEIRNLSSGQSRPFKGTWTQLEDGRVRQQFEDLREGKWNTGFDGFYTKAVQ